MSETSRIHSGAIVPAHLAETPKFSCPSLARRPCTPQATKHQLASSRQAISQHLDVLEQAGLIRSERRGRYKFHELDTTPLERIVDHWVRTIKEDVCASSCPVSSSMTRTRQMHFYTHVLGFQKQTEIPLGEHRWLTVVSPDEPDGTELVLEPDTHPAKPFKAALASDGIPSPPSPSTTCTRSSSGLCGRR